MTALAGTLGALIAGNASAQPFDQYRDGPIVLPESPVELFNDGKYAIIERKSRSDRNKKKSVEVQCPEGMRAMSVGPAAASSRGEPDDWRVIYSQPNETGTAWVVVAMFDSSGDRDSNGVVGAPGPYEWQLEVRLVCAKLS